MPETTPPASRPPLLILSVAAGYGGAERNIEIMLPHLLAERRVAIFAANPLHLERLRRLGHPGLEIHEVDAARPNFVAHAARRVVLRVLALRPSAILSNTFDSLDILVGAARWLPGLDAIACVCVHDFMWRDPARLLPRIPRATLLVPDRSVLEKPDYLTGHVWPHGPMRAVVMPNPVDIPADPATGLADGAPFLHLATMNRLKGHAALVQAAALLVPRCPDLRMISAGHRQDAELYRRIEETIAATGLRHVVSLRDHVPDPSPLLRQARAVLVTTTSDNGGPEAFGRSIIEAWAHGRPAIAFACGAPAQLIRHEIDGLLVDEGDVQGLAEAMERLHCDPALADRLGRNGRERAEHDFAAPRVRTQLTAVLDGRWCRRTFSPPAHTAASGPAILFDVSLALDRGWHAPAGMSRVEQNTAAQLAAQPTAVQLVRRSPEEDGFRRLNGQELEFLANTQDGLGQLANAELAAIPMPPRRAMRPLRSLLHRMIPRGLKRRMERRGWTRRPATPAPARPLVAQSGDVLLSVSNPWDHLAPAIFKALRARGVRVVLAVHDLMVWETPQWTAGRDPRRYTADMLGALAEADQLVAVSHHTQQQVQRALREEGRAVPPLRVAWPAGLDTGRTVPGSPPVGLPPDRPFVVFCSTIEIRKNHILLLNLWEQLRQQLPAARLPVLVLAGRWGWGVDSVRLAVERNWRLAPHILVAPALRDEQLHWLYRHARFSVFPSFTEGFGLPVAESLAAGTPVVISNHPALVEASAGLMPALDPGDLPRWTDEIRRLCLDDAYLAELRDRARTYRPAPADGLPRALLDAVGLAP